VRLGEERKHLAAGELSIALDELSGPQMTELVAVKPLISLVDEGA
jgi:hypothetical protein